jgi:hypothetical protein
MDESTTQLSIPQGRERRSTRSSRARRSALSLLERADATATYSCLRQRVHQPHEQIAATQGAARAPGTQLHPTP